MDTLSYKTVSANRETVNKEWVLIDAENQILGRMSSVAAKFLRGKYKTNFTPHVDCGDNVIIINAEKIVLTGKKMTDKEYVRYTGYPGGQRRRTPAELLKIKPTAVVEKAIKGMLPKNRLGADLFRNLYVINTIGRRKTAIARIYLKDGKGKITVNKRDYTEYFSLATLQYIVKQPFEITETTGKYDVVVNLDGGGIKGQAEALRLAISKALVDINADYRPLLKVKGLMRRDPRMVERKKYGQKKARKKFQFSKR